MTETAGHYGVVVAVDGFPASRLAADWAARDAVLRGAKLTVVYVQADTDASTFAVIAIPEQFRFEQKGYVDKIVRNALDAIAAAIADRGPLTVDWKILCGNTMPALVDLSKDAALVVVGSRGLGAP